MGRPRRSLGVTNTGTEPAPATAITHLVITGMKDGKNVEWMEKVTDAQYSGK